MVVVILVSGYFRGMMTRVISTSPECHNGLERRESSPNGVTFLIYFYPYFSLVNYGNLPIYIYVTLYNWGYCNTYLKLRQKVMFMAIYLSPVTNIWRAEILHFSTKSRMCSQGRSYTSISIQYKYI